MKKFNTVLELAGLLLVAFGLMLALYTGIMWGIVGGIVDISMSFPDDGPIDKSLMAIGVLKVIFSELIGAACGFLPVAFGCAMVHSSRPPHRR